MKKLEFKIRGDVVTTGFSQPIYGSDWLNDEEYEAMKSKLEANEKVYDIKTFQSTYT